MRQTSDRRVRGEGRGRASPAAPARDDAPKASLYDEVTARIVAQLEAGVFPWVQPWGRPGGAAPGLPRNAATGRRYSGVNILLLWGAVIAHGYPSQDWLTFKQALAAGGAVRKGERGTTVVYADRFTPEAEKERARERGEDARVVPFLKRFTVFNLAQCEGFGRLAPEPSPLPERRAVPAAEALIKATGADFRIGGDRAFYAPGPDYVQVPPQPAFHDQINYYRTALHELTHWTGHPTRLHRDLSGGFGSDAYAREELAAEMGAAFLCAALGIVPTVRHADYLANWLAVLRADNRAIFRAASQASKAADFLMAFAPDPDAEAARVGEAARIAA
ncbi:ArdC family protein [Brevundimonas sp. SORGH_AS_0993]|uniref:ArdC family protein n=1 Tax=Brevundimonas sp. SORGH_AS_0993 TaxID=3041794 RepID=UPI00278622EF|nr:zincin-like metallopeptidase domain-containing protein [Brevundimonas sp. SORGH_AS_0993]MDQ1153429.1 antirestriction protein ArdC [Brevundimonas sp. SORGH_AS_0993]